MRFEFHTEAFVEDANILWCDTVSFGTLFPMFQKSVVPFTSRCKRPKKNGLGTSWSWMAPPGSPQLIQFLRLSFTLRGKQPKKNGLEISWSWMAPAGTDPSLQGPQLINSCGSLLHQGVNSPRRMDLGLLEAGWHHQGQIQVLQRLQLVQFLPLSF
jgi:hypothetical protein